MLQTLADTKPLICNGIQYRNRIIDIMENGPGPLSTPSPRPFPVGGPQSNLQPPTATSTILNLSHGL